MVLVTTGLVSNGAVHGSAPNIIFDALQPTQFDLRPLRQEVELPLIYAKPNLTRLDRQWVEVQGHGPARSKLLHGAQHPHGTADDGLGDLFADIL